MSNICYNIVTIDSIHGASKEFLNNLMKELIVNGNFNLKPLEAVEKEEPKCSMENTPQFMLEVAENLRDSINDFPEETISDWYNLIQLSYNPIVKYTINLSSKGIEIPSIPLKDGYERTLLIPNGDKEALDGYIKEMTKYAKAWDTYNKLCGNGSEDYNLLTDEELEENQLEVLFNWLDDNTLVIGFPTKNSNGFDVFETLALLTGLKTKLYFGFITSSGTFEINEIEESDNGNVNAVVKAGKVPGLRNTYTLLEILGLEDSCIEYFGWNTFDVDHMNDSYEDWVVEMPANGIE